MCWRQAECSRPLNKWINYEINLINSVFMKEMIISLSLTDDDVVDMILSPPVRHVSPAAVTGQRALVILVLLGFIWIQIFRLQGRRSGVCWTSGSIMSFFFFYLDWTGDPDWGRKLNQSLFSQQLNMLNTEALFLKLKYSWHENKQKWLSELQCFVFFPPVW